jgi:hypothetical protein
VALVEAVPREELEVAPDLLRRRLRHVALDRAVDEQRLVLGHDLGLLLAHGLPQAVRLVQREAAEAVGDAHHLLLVDAHAVRLLQHLLERRVRVARLLLAVLPSDEGVDHAASERPRPVERQDGDEVLERVRLERASSSRMPSDSSWKTPRASPPLVSSS